MRRYLLQALPLLLALLVVATAESVPPYKRGARVQGGGSPDLTPPVLGGSLSFTVAATALTIDWDDATGDPTYYIVLAAVGSETSPGCSSGTVLTGCDSPAASTCTATGLTQMVSYAISVCAVDAAGNRSAAVDGWEQPFADTMAVRFGFDDPATVTNELLTVADNAAWDGGDTNDRLVKVLIYRPDVCADGATCDDFVAVNGTRGDVTDNDLIEYGGSAGTYRTRKAYGALAQWAQLNVLRSDGTNSTGQLGRWTREATAFVGAGATNDDKHDYYARQCDTATPPVCGVMSTELSAGIGACGTPPCFFGSLPADLGNDATAKFLGGDTATDNYNFVGALSEYARFYPPTATKPTAANFNDCVFDGTTGRVRNLRTMSKRTTTGGTNCADVFGEAPAVWYRGGDGEAAACAGDAVVLTNFGTGGAATLTATNMECADLFSHGL